MNVTVTALGLAHLFIGAFLTSAFPYAFPKKEEPVTNRLTDVNNSQYRRIVLVYTHPIHIDTQKTWISGTRARRHMFYLQTNMHTLPEEAVYGY